MSCTSSGPVRRAATRAPVWRGHSGQVDEAVCLVSIHDVMPSTFGEVEALLVELDRQGAHPCTLLVVPGLRWSSLQIDMLRHWVGLGHTLAGHGWVHQCTAVRSFSHRLHACFFSRNVAEHLALNATGIAELVQRCHDWFSAVGLQAPMLYVPPAWAMGSIPSQRLQSLPFRYYETFTGVYDAGRDVFHRMPLVAFEADRWWRVPVMRTWNRLSDVVHRRTGLPLRVSIHPFDACLPMRRDLLGYLARRVQWAGYGDVSQS